MQSLNAAVGCRSIVVSSSTCADVILVISKVLLAEDVSALVTQDIRINNMVTYMTSSYVCRDVKGKECHKEQNCT